MTDRRRFHAVMLTAETRPITAARTWTAGKMNGTALSAAKIQLASTAVDVQSKGN